jgi:hypothetical protein
MSLENAAQINITQNSQAKKNELKPQPKQKKGQKISKAINKTKKFNPNKSNVSLDILSSLSYNFSLKI